MRFLTYNIHGCVGRDGREDPGRILDIIQEVDADVVGLQEVHSNDRPDLDFLEKLKELPYRAILYGKTMRKPNADYGNILLLREPPVSEERIELETNSGEPRGAIVADIIRKNKSIRVINTHLGLSATERKKQCRKILKYLPPLDSEENCILLGDLNEWLPIRAYFRQLRRQFRAVSEQRTFPVKPALFALDRIAICGKIRDYRFSTHESELAAVGSDHKPLICDLTI